MTQTQQNTMPLIKVYEDSEPTLKEAQKNESLTDGIFRLFQKCASIKNSDFEGKNIRSVIGSLCKIRAQLEEFDEWINIPLHVASENIKDGNINEAMRPIQHELSLAGIATEESEALAHLYTSKLAVKLGCWEEASKILKESKSTLEEYKKTKN